MLDRLPNGIGLYRYRYIWSDQVYVGVMAQEVAQIVPDAVVRGADGFLRVNYARLGMRLLTWDEWAAKSRRQATAAERKCPIAGVGCDLVVRSSPEAGAPSHKRIRGICCRVVTSRP